MRVLQFFKNYFPPTHGGIEQLINGIVHGISGFEFVVLTGSHTRELIDDSDDGVRVIRAPELLRVSTAPLAPSWRAWIKRIAPDVIHVHMPNPTGELAVLTSRTDARIVASFHAEIVRAPTVSAAYRAFLPFFWPKVHTVIAGSPPMLATAKELDGVRDRAVVVPYGIDPDEFGSRPPEADAIRERYPGSLVLFMGVLRHYKGVHVLVEAMRDVPDATLVVAGEGPERASVEAAVDAFGLSGRVHLVGSVTDAERVAYMRAADLFVLPAISRAEAFGIVLTQAMACGTPVISTELGTGTSWVNADGETGLVVPARDARALARAIASLLGDDERRAAMGRAAQLRVRARFTTQQMFASLAGIYREAGQAR
ncbi:MAG: glycosyltransferase [Actinobacteria bacterium]|nr:glycosyltransferase [Actinomycetota bacterium]